MPPDNFEGALPGPTSGGSVTLPGIDLSLPEANLPGPDGGSVTNPTGYESEREFFSGVGRAVEGSVDNEPGGGIVEGLLNVGPDWLDEATAVAVPIVVVLALLWLARPLLTVVAEGVAE